MIITKETKIFGSFSKQPGNNGANFFNKSFKKNGINAIYIPVKCSITSDAFSIMKLMNFSGAALASPHKIESINFVDIIDDTAKEIGAINTVVFKNNTIYGYNTDWFGVSSILSRKKIKRLYIYGTGGFSLAVQYTCKRLNIPFLLFDRNQKLPLDGTTIFNATPINLQRENVIDGRPNTISGMKIFLEQAKKQYEIYFKN